MNVSEWKCAGREKNDRILVMIPVLLRVLPPNTVGVGMERDAGGWRGGCSIEKAALWAGGGWWVAGGKS